VVDEIAVPMLGTSLGIKGKGKLSGYDIGSEVYFLGGKDFLLYGQAQYMFYPSLKGKLKPYLGTGISFPMFWGYEDNMSVFRENKYVFEWNENFIFGIKSTVGFTYPIKTSKGFTEFGVTYPMFNGKDLGLYNKESIKAPNVINMKIGFLF